MTELLYLNDHYLKAFDATVVEVPDLRSIVFDKTAVYPRGGGQPSDHATVTLDGNRFEIVESTKTPEKVIHQLSSELNEFQRSSALNSNVHVVLDWDL